MRRQVCSSDNCQNQQNSNASITNEIRKTITKRDKLFLLWEPSPSEGNKNLYKRQGNVVTSLIRNANRDCKYIKLGNNPSSVTIYCTLKYQLATHEPKNSIPDINKLNEYFTSIGQILSSKVRIYDSPVNVPSFEKAMVLNYSDENEVAQILNGLKKNKKSVGCDRLSNEMLKHCSSVIEKYLSEVFNNSILEKIPDFLKLAKVAPICKKGDKTSPENYKPICL